MDPIKQAPADKLRELIQLVELRRRACV